MLEQIIKAENKGLLEEIKAECIFPVSLATIKNYVSILIPAYLFNITSIDNRLQSLKLYHLFRDQFPIGK